MWISIIKSCVNSGYSSCKPTNFDICYLCNNDSGGTNTINLCNLDTWRKDFKSKIPMGMPPCQGSQMLGLILISDQYIMVVEICYTIIVEILRMTIQIQVFWILR